MLAVSGKLMSWLFDQGMRGVVVKKGSQGVDIHPPTSGLTLNSFSVNAIDTTGAGDSFAGGLIHGLANGYPLPEAAVLANACGAFTTTIEGPHGVFSLEELRHFISSFKDNNS
jgi:sugar/nucleoside kinase (ribokinase family)